MGLNRQANGPLDCIISAETGYYASSATLDAANVNLISPFKFINVMLAPLFEPHCEEAKKLVASLYQQYPHFPHAGASKAKCLSVLASILQMVRLSTLKEGAALGCPRSKKYWSGYHVGMDLALRVVDALDGSILNKVHDGRLYNCPELKQTKNGSVRKVGIVTQYQATEALTNNPRFYHAEFIEVHRPCLGSKKPQRKSERYYYKHNGLSAPKLTQKELHHMFRADYRQMNSRQDQLNAFWLMHPLRVPSFGNNSAPHYAACATRIFHGSPHNGGRYYGAWTNIGNAHRLCSTINGEVVVSIDLNASQPTLLSSLLGMKMRVGNEWDDLYNHVALLSVDDVELSRHKLKAVATELIGTGNPNKSGPSDDNRPLFGSSNDWHAYRLALLSTVPALLQLDNNYMNGAGFLSYHEARIMEQTLFSLMAQGIAGYPIHDCVIVAAPHQEEAIQTYRNVVNCYVTQHCKEQNRDAAIDIIVPVSIESHGADKRRLSGYYR